MLLFYGAGALVLMLVVPLVMLFTRDARGRERFSPETRRQLLLLYVVVVGALVGVGALARQMLASGL